MHTLIELAPQNKTYYFCELKFTYGPARLSVGYRRIIDWMIKMVSNPLDFDLKIYYETSFCCNTKKYTRNIKFVLTDTTAERVFILPHYEESVLSMVMGYTKNDDIEYYNKLISLVEDQTNMSIAEITDDNYHYLELKLWHIIIL